MPLSSFSTWLISFSCFCQDPNANTPSTSIFYRHFYYWVLKQVYTTCNLISSKILECINGSLRSYLKSFSKRSIFVPKLLNLINFRHLPNIDILFYFFNWLMLNWKMTTLLGAVLLYMIRLLFYLLLQFSYNLSQYFNLLSFDFYMVDFFSWLDAWGFF